VQRCGQQLEKIRDDGGPAGLSAIGSSGGADSGGADDARDTSAAGPAMGEDGLVGWVYATYLRLLSGRQGPGGFAGLLSGSAPG
jgi:hypothetical protein